jgi:hypothetical protein
MVDKILNLVSTIAISGFFLTVECSREGDKMPEGIQNFITEKLRLIDKGAEGRKFVYQEGGWRLIFTFFPTDSVVEEKYALKNKVCK